MAFGLVFYDLLYLTLASAMYGGALCAGVHAYAWLAARVPWPIAAVLAVYAALAVLIAEAGLATLPCPRLEPGLYEMMKGRVFFGWIFRSLIRRVLFVPGVKWLIFSSNVLRFCALRALGADVAFSSNLSADADLLDPALITLGPGAIVGARCILTGHFVQDGKLLLGTVKVERGALLAGEVGMMPNTSVGPKALIKSRVSLSLGSVVGAGAHVGGATGVDANAKIGAKARVGNMCYIGPRAEVPEGAEVPSGTQFR
jgi:acetyltransferase-like isoleucine patch superfamily enzyme